MASRGSPEIPLGEEKIRVGPNEAGRKGVLDRDRERRKTSQQA